MSNFYNLLKKTYIYNRRMVWLTAGAVMLACILFGSAMGLLGEGGGTGEVVCFGLMFLLGGTVTASMAFGDFKTKAGKIETLMTPATAFQKFAVRWIAVVPLMTLLFVAGFYVGDLCRIVANNFSDNYVAGAAYHRVVNVWHVVTHIISPNTSLTATALLVGYFFWQSVYLLGGILWPKFSFIKTFAILRVANLVILPLLNRLDLAVFYPLSKMVYIGTWLTIATALLTVGMYWLTYYVMKRSTVA